MIATDADKAAAMRAYKARFVQLSVRVVRSAHAVARSLVSILRPSRAAIGRP